MADFAVMGLAEVLPHLRLIRKRRILDLARSWLEAERPDVLVTIDSPAFTLRRCTAL